MINGRNDISDNIAKDYRERVFYDLAGQAHLTLIREGIVLSKIKEMHAVKEFVNRFRALDNRPYDMAIAEYLSGMSDDEIKQIRNITREGIKFLLKIKDIYLVQRSLSKTVFDYGDQT